MSTDFADCVVQGDRLLACKEARPAGAIIRPTENDKDQQTGWYEVVKLGAEWSRKDVQVGDRIMFEKGQAHVLDGKAFVSMTPADLRLVLPKGKGAPRSVPVASSDRAAPAPTTQAAP